MKKTIIMLLLVMLLIVSVVGCRNGLTSFTKAYIKLPGGKEMTVNIKRWSYLDLRGSKMLIIDENGDKYICSSFNVTLLEDDANVVNPYEKNTEGGN